MEKREPTTEPTSVRETRNRSVYLGSGPFEIMSVIMALSLILVILGCVCINWIRRRLG